MMSRGAPARAQSDGDILDILCISELPSQYKTKQLGFSGFITLTKIWATKIEDRGYQYVIKEPFFITQRFIHTTTCMFVKLF